MHAGPATNRAASGPEDGAAVSDATPAEHAGRDRTGKISRLPHAVRESLNERLRDGIRSCEIAVWLNSLPTVREVLEKRMDGSLITEDNVFKWRRGGYLDWLEHQRNKEAVASMGAGCRSIDPAERDGLAGQISFGITARLVTQMRNYDELPEGALKTAAWRDLVLELSFCGCLFGGTGQ
jgi:hypothetical protein